MLPVIFALRFVHHTWALSPELSRYASRTHVRIVQIAHDHSNVQAGQTGVHCRDLLQKCKDLGACSCSGTERVSYVAPASMRLATTPRTRAAWHNMGDKFMPAASNRPRMAISALMMHSSCLFRQWQVDSAACAPCCTAAQPFRSSHSASRRARRYLRHSGLSKILIDLLVFSSSLNNVKTC